MAAPRSYNIQQQLSSLQSAPSDIILLLGQTGGGKSSVANKLVNVSACQESAEMTSCTSELQAVSSKFFGTKEPVTVVDTPGFLDSERRDTQFLTEITAFLRDFPKNKLRVVLVTLPLMETRAKSTYKDMLDEVEMLLGEEVWEHTVFVTTLQNQLKSAQLAQDKIDGWKTWLHDTCHLSGIKHCNFLYDNAASLEPVRELFNRLRPFTPKTSEKIEAFIKSNPSASVAEVIQGVDDLSKMKQQWEDKLAALIAEKQEFVDKLQSQQQLSSRLQNSLEETQGEIARLKKALEEKPTEVHNHYHSCCFPSNATVKRKGDSGRVKISTIVEGEEVMTMDENGRETYSEVYFLHGKEVESTMCNIFFAEEEEEEERSIRLTADHVIFVTDAKKIRPKEDGVVHITEKDITSLTAENVIPHKHAICVKGSQGGRDSIQWKIVRRVEVKPDFGLYTILVKQHRLFVDDVLVSAYEINHTWGIIDTIPMRCLYWISPSFVTSHANKVFCQYYDIVVETCIKTLRSVWRYLVK